MRKRTPTRRPNLSREQKLRRQGFIRIAGLDEAGRGAWAGPLAAAAVILPEISPRLRIALRDVRDSKQMRPRERTAAAKVIQSIALGWAVGQATAVEVDALGPVRATRLAMIRALANLPSIPDFLLLDYLQLEESSIPQLAIIHGDALSLSIAAASVLAKTWRDERMLALEGAYPGYGFARHKGYGTREHARALEKMGVCPEHRLSYRPVKAACD